MINENNYETFFMSYIDNELNAAERAAVEAFVLTDSKYAGAMAVFEKATVKPKAICKAMGMVKMVIMAPVQAVAKLLVCSNKKKQIKTKK
jgi:anti-sigma factor RsiW